MSPVSKGNSSLFCNASRYLFRIHSYGRVHDPGYDIQVPKTSEKYQILFYSVAICREFVHFYAD